MDFERVSDHIFRIEFPLISAGPFKISVTAWLVQGEGGWTLIDSGPENSMDVLVNAIARTTRGDALPDDFGISVGGAGVANASFANPRAW